MAQSHSKYSINDTYLCMVMLLLEMTKASSCVGIFSLDHRGLCEASLDFLCSYQNSFSSLLLQLHSSENLVFVSLSTQCFGIYRKMKRVIDFKTILNQFKLLLSYHRDECGSNCHTDREQRLCGSMTIPWLLCWPLP